MIKEAIDEKPTYPKMLRVGELLEMGDKDELRALTKQLMIEKKIRIRDGINNKLIEVI